MRANGAANLGILQGFVPNIRSTGQATLEATLDGPMRTPARHRHDDDRRRPHPSLRFAACAREHLGRRPLRFARRHARRSDRAARRRPGAVRRPHRHRGVSPGPSRRDDDRPEHAAAVSRKACARSSTRTSTLQGTVDAATLVAATSTSAARSTRAVSIPAAGSSISTGSASGQAPASIQTTVPLRYDVAVQRPGDAARREQHRAAGRQRRSASCAAPTIGRSLVGRGEVERGEFNFEGKRYIITRGTIDFNNPTRIEPFFDIQTETQVRVPSQTYRVMVRVTGTMARFTPTFSSDPPLTEVQVLSLLFSDVAPGQDVEFSQYSARHAAGAAAPRARGARADRGADDGDRPRG